MKFYARHSVVGLTLAGLSLILLMTMPVPSAYAQYPHKTTGAVTAGHQHSTAETDKIISSVSTVYRDISQLPETAILAAQLPCHEMARFAEEHHNNELYDENNHHDCCDVCENVETNLSQSINNKTKDSQVLPVRYTKSIPLWFAAINTAGFIDPSAPSPLQGTLRYRTLLI